MIEIGGRGGVKRNGVQLQGHQNQVPTISRGEEGKAYGEKNTMMVALDFF